MVNNDYSYNSQKPTIRVEHKKLKRDNKNSIFKSICPVCKEGILLVQRGAITRKIRREDFCIRCGQPFYYTDIEYLEPTLRIKENLELILDD